MNFGIERRLHLSGGSRDIDQHPARMHLIDREAVAPQPRDDTRDVLARRPVSRTELAGSQPRMVIR